jgi:uncharacterized protein (TIGR02145 family)
VVGFSHNGQDNGGAFSLDAIKFNPSNSTPSDYAGVPVYTSAVGSGSGWNTDAAGSQIISSPNYHNVANLTAGKGDPCKLVGLTVAQIKTNLNSGNVPDSGWRLPSPRENHSFVGDPAWNSETLSGNVYSSIGSPTFEQGYSFDSSNGDFLPAAGYRGYTSGDVSFQNGRGAYWSSTPHNSGRGHNIYFITSSVTPSNNIRYDEGCAIRCVKP